VGLHRAKGATRRTAVPDGLGDPVGRDDLVSMEDQRRKERLAANTSEADFDAVAHRANRPKDLGAHSAVGIDDTGPGG
jgi:hypothetical protein